MRSNELAGKTVMMTGAGRGMGRAMSIALAAAGAKVAMIDLDADVLAEAGTSSTARSAPRRSGCARASIYMVIWWAAARSGAAARGPKTCRRSWVWARRQSLLRRSWNRGTGTSPRCATG